MSISILLACCFANSSDAPPDFENSSRSRLALRHVALAEVRLTALELRLVVVRLRLDRLGERLDRLVLVALVVVAHAEHVPDVRDLVRAGHVRRALLTRP